MTEQDTYSVDELRALAEAGVSLTSELALEAVLQRLVDLARGLVRARYAALSVLSSGGNIDEFVTSGISEEERKGIGHIPQGKGLLGVLLREGSSLRLDKMNDDPRSGGFPPNHPQMQSLLGVPVVFADTIVGNLYLTDRLDGEPFDDRDEEVVRLLATQAAVAINNARLYEASRRRADEWKALFELGRRVSASPDLQQLLDSTVSKARDLLDGDAAALMMLRGADSLYTAAQQGLRDGATRLPRPVSEHALVELTLKGRRPVVVVDAGKDERLTGKRGKLVEEEGLVSLICVPLNGKEGPVGTLTVGNRTRTQYDERDAELLEAFANWTTVAIEANRLYDRLEGVARLEERERIAMDLHDGVIQSIYAVGLHLEDCLDRIKTEPAEVAAVLERSMDGLHQVIKDIRSYIFDLRPKVSQVEDLPGAVRQLVEDVRVNTLMDARVEELDPVEGLLNEPQALAFFHIAQEALNNVAKHSRATSVSLSLTASDECVRLEVVDNGVGFATENPNEQKHGLRNMRDRARAIGATLSYESKPRYGTSVIAELPIHAKETADD